jgi:drug/metabolite transporter (DMT)-like permease
VGHDDQPEAGPSDRRGDCREARIDAIVEVGRRTRQGWPRWLWIAAALVGVICATGFAVVMLADAKPTVRPIERRAEPGAGLGTGLVLGAVCGAVIGFVLARQRRDHSSRNRP